MVVAVAAAFLLGPAAVILLLGRGERGAPFGAAAWIVLAGVGLYFQWREFVDH